MLDSAVLTASQSDIRTGESLQVIPVSADQARRAGQDPATWTAEDLRDYVAEEIARTGPQLPCRDSLTIMIAFRARFGPEKAGLIARTAFEACRGMWMGAPVTWRRFQPENDQFFSSRILEASQGG